MSSIEDDRRISDDVLAAIGYTPSKRAERTRTGPREPISPLVRQLVFRRDHWTCQNCGAYPYAASESRRSGALHLDHIKPWSNWGSDRSDNLRTLCADCNMDRSNFVTGDEEPAMPIVGICTHCVLMDGTPKPDTAFTVYCGSHSHEGWAIPGWKIL